MAVTTWEDLAALRESGQKPALPVVVTTNKRLCWNLSGVGCMTILHHSGKPMPVELLEGLHVLLMFGSCERSAAVWRLMKAKEVQPAKCEAWCACEGTLTQSVGHCEDLRAINVGLGLA